MKILLRIAIFVALNGAIFWALDHQIFEEKFNISGTGIQAYFFVAFILGILNLFIKPIIEIITLPFQVITLGIFSVFVNGFMLWILSHTVDMFPFFPVELEIQGITTYLVAGIIIALLNWLIGLLPD